MVDTTKLNRAALVGVAVAPQLSARVLGDTYVVRVAPVDPIDPFRGAYVSLTYPGLPNPQTTGPGAPVGTVYVPLVPDPAALAVPGVDPDWTGPRGLRLRPDVWTAEGGIDGFFAARWRKV